MRRARLLTIATCLAFCVLPAQIASQRVAPVTTPAQAFGAGIGDDYFLATYTQLEAYWKTLDRESDRLQLVDIGRTEEGRTMWMAVLSAPENLARLDRYRDIAARLARAEGVTDAQARALAAEGKAIVWIDGGLHADEVLGAQQLIELVYQLTSRTDPETLRILRDVIVLVADVNPDGHELVANWYMRRRNPRERSLAELPRLYQKYVGHDDNRDFYMNTQRETRNVSRVLYREWFPQIVYDHHQTGPPGTVMFAPPFRDPFNYVFDPLMPSAIDLFGAAMHARFAVEGKPGVTMRSGSTYSTWWNGGLRTTAYFHNQIGLLTETIGDPTPTAIPAVRERQQPGADLPYPIAPQPWHFRQSIAYEMTANLAVLDAASRYREHLLFNLWRMGANGIERGRRDTWTPSPRVLRAGERPELRDPRGYVIPAGQPDFLTATKFVAALLESGVQVLRATAPFSAGGRTFPAGSFVVKTAQAFRPHVLDMFEPQDHPDDIPYPGAAPTPPYDAAGWTLALQMGVAFERVLDGFDGPFVPVTSVAVPGGTVDGVERPAGYVVSQRQNDAYAALARLLAAGEKVYWPRDRTVGGGDTGAMYVAARPSTAAVLRRAAAELGLTFTGVASPPPGQALELRPVRVGLWDRYGGSVPSGWTRWLFERFDVPFTRVYAKQIDAGDLIARFDVIVMPSDAVPASRSPMRGDGSSVVDLSPADQATTGTLTWTDSVPALKAFVEAGGTLLLAGDATDIAARIGVPLEDGLSRPGGERPGADRYYIPGSLLQVRVDNAQPLGYGVERQAVVFFDNSRVFRLAAGAPASAASRVAWFAGPAPLRSGWALGQQYLDGALAVVDAPLGKGRVIAYGPEVTFRGQSHGTFKFLFNGIYYPHAVPVERIPAP